MVNEQQFIDGAFKAGLNPQQVSQAVKVYRQKNPPKSVGGFIGNVARSGGRAIGGIASAVLNPVETAKNVVNTSSGALQLLQPGEQGQEQYARDLGKFYKDRYGGLDKIANTLYNDPVGAALDVSTVLGGAGSLAKGVGAVTKTGEIGQFGRALTTASELTDPFQLAGKGIGRATSGTRGKLGSALASESENILTRGMGNPATLKKAKGVSPITMDELFRKYNTYDRSPEAFQAGAKAAGTQVKSMLRDAPVSIETKAILDRFDAEIAKLAEEARTSSKSRLAMEELASRKQMFLDGIQQEGATPLYNDAAKVYEIKSNFQGDVAPSTFGMPSQDVGKNLGTTKAYKTLLSGIEEKAPGIKNLGREQSALLKLKDMAESQAARGAAKQNINFSRMGGAGVGGILGGIPGAIGGYAAEQVANSPQFLAGASKAMKIGSKVVGGVKLPSRVTNTVGNVYRAGKAGRMLNVNQGELRSSKASQTQQPSPAKNVTYPSSISGMSVNKQIPSVTKEIKFKLPKNTFKNKSAFGKSFKLKSGGM